MSVTHTLLYRSTRTDVTVVVFVTGFLVVAVTTEVPVRTIVDITVEVTVLYILLSAESRAKGKAEND